MLRFVRRTSRGVPLARVRISPPPEVRTVVFGAKRGGALVLPVAPPADGLPPGPEFGVRSEEPAPPGEPVFGEPVFGDPVLGDPPPGALFRLRPAGVRSLPEGIRSLPDGVRSLPEGTRLLPPGDGGAPPDVGM